MSKTPRIQIGDVVLKPVGRGWGIGLSSPRVIKGKETEELIRPTYTGGARVGIPYFLGRVRHEHGDELGRAERELMDALTYWENQTFGDRPTLAAPDLACIAARGELSQRAFARLAGLGKTTIQNVENGDVDPQCSTLLKILLAGQRRRE